MAMYEMYDWMYEIIWQKSCDQEISAHLQF